MNTDEHRCSPAATKSNFHRWVVPGSARILRVRLVSAEIVSTLEACAPRKTRIKNLPVSSTELFLSVFICGFIFFTRADENSVCSESPVLSWLLGKGAVPGSADLRLDCGLGSSGGPKPGKRQACDSQFPP